MSITPVGCEFEALLDYLKREHNFDFSHLTRQIEIRMQQVGFENISDDRDYISGISARVYSPIQHD